MYVPIAAVVSLTVCFFSPSASDSFSRFWRYTNLYVCMYMYVCLSEKMGKIHALLSDSA